MEEQIEHKGILWGTNKRVAQYHIDRFEEFIAQSPERIKQLCTNDDGRLKHIARAEHFDKNFIDIIVFV